MPLWLLTPARRIIRAIANVMLPKNLQKARSTTTIKHNSIIVSLTSFPGRIEDVWKVISCIKCQTLLPKKIILWLSNEQFANKGTLPDILLEMEDDIFEIRFVEGDIRSHKKYYYVAKEFGSMFVVLIDDDIFYPPTMIEELFESYQKGEGDVICRYGYRIARDDNGDLLPYNSWPMLYKEAFGSDVFFGSGGGTLFSPSSFNPELLNIERALSLTPIADDIWLNAMTRYSHLNVKMLKHGSFLPIISKTKVGLCQQNQGNNLNDEQLQNVVRYFSAKGFVFRKNLE